MKLKKLTSLLVTTLFLSFAIAAPVSAATLSPSNMPGADVRSIWNVVQEMTNNQRTVPEPAPKAEPTPQPAPKAEPRPQPAPKAEPAPKPTPQPAPNSGTQMSAFQKRVVELVNIERGKEGLQPLAANPLLMKGASAKSQDMVDNRYFSHTSPQYGSPFAMMKTFGIRYHYAGENIASGQTSPEAVVRSWMNSPGHRANIMSSKFNKIGVGHAYTSAGNYHHFWTQWFTD